MYYRSGKIAGKPSLGIHVDPPMASIPTYLCNHKTEMPKGGISRPKSTVSVHQVTNTRNTFETFILIFVVFTVSAI